MFRRNGKHSSRYVELVKGNEHFKALDGLTTKRDRADMYADIFLIVISMGVGLAVGSDVFWLWAVVLTIFTFPYIIASEYRRRFELEIMAVEHQIDGKV